MSALKLRPTSEAEAKEFVELCLRQGISREKIAEFLVHLKLDAKLALPAAPQELMESGDLSLELEIDELLIRESVRSDVHHALPVATPAVVPAPVPEGKIVLESYPRRKKSEAEDEFAASSAPARLLRDDRQSTRWFRLALALTMTALIALFASSWSDSPDRFQVADALQPTKTPSAPVKAMKRTPAAISVGRH